MKKGKGVVSSDEEYFFSKDPKWKQRPNCNRGSWGLEEQSNYLKFLMSHERLFQSSKRRRKTKAFEKLAKALKKRSPAQCRSYYQKL